MKKILLIKANTKKDMSCTRHVIGRRDAQGARSANQRAEDTFPDTRSLMILLFLYILVLAKECH